MTLVTLFVRGGHGGDAGIELDCTCGCTDICAPDDPVGITPVDPTDETPGDDLTAEPVSDPDACAEDAAEAPPVDDEDPAIETPDDSEPAPDVP